ncbi:MAG TPA: GntR family transcriptional regulator [Chloroflexota bacterium]|nr:GntR family transcriptional regulator [Chloroflexota bacterium]
MRWQGKGVFVGQPRPNVPRMPLQSFTEETLARGHAPSSRTLRFVRLPANPRVSGRLGLRPDEGVLLLERLRLADAAAFHVDRTTGDQHGRTIEFATSILRGDRCAVQLNLRRQVTEQLAEYQAI